MIFAQEVEDFLRLGGFGEGGVAAQIAEHDDDLAAMAFEERVAGDPNLKLEAPHGTDSSQTQRYSNR